ncbi:MAG: hypothetical protein FJ403_01220 [Verrucomicrobia bacterium]|nr:hypothetical protein [Verrucomicrobiota bacterium]
MGTRGWGRIEGDHAEAVAMKGDALPAQAPASYSDSDLFFARNFRRSVPPSFLEQDDGTYWFGLGGGGALRLSGPTLFAFAAPTPLPNGRVMDIQAVPDGGIWFATSGGLARYESG